MKLYAVKATKPDGTFRRLYTEAFCPLAAIAIFNGKGYREHGAVISVSVI